MSFSQSGRPSFFTKPSGFVTDAPAPTANPSLSSFQGGASAPMQPSQTSFPSSFPSSGNAPSWINNFRNTMMARQSNNIQPPQRFGDGQQFGLGNRFGPWNQNSSTTNQWHPGSSNQQYDGYISSGPSPGFNVSETPGDSSVGANGGVYGGPVGLLGLGQDIASGGSPSAGQIGMTGAMAGLGLLGAPMGAVGLLGAGLNAIGFQPSTDPHGVGGDSSGVGQSGTDDENAGSSGGAEVGQAASAAAYGGGGEEGGASGSGGDSSADAGSGGAADFARGGRVNRTNHPSQRMAKKLASHGRYGDSMLMHVNPSEVRGLASLGAQTGRPVTINPKTGLPEAFSFTDLIPSALGIAATVLTGGAAAPFVPFIVGGSAAAKTALEGGSFEDSLLSGVIGGASSWAGGNLLGAGFDAAGAAAQAVPFTPEALLAAGAPQLGASDLASAAMADTGLNPMALSQGFATTAAVPQTGMAGIGTNISNAMSNPGAFGKGVLDYGKDHMFQSALAAAPLLGIGSYNPVEGPEKRKNAPLNENFGQPRERNYVMPGEEYSPGKDPEFQYGFGNTYGTFARGGPVRRFVGGGEINPTNMSPVNPPMMNPAMPPPSPFGAQPYFGGQQPMAQQAPQRGQPMQGQPMYGQPVRAFARGGIAELENRQGMGTTANVINEAKAALLGEHPRPQEAVKRFVDMFGPSAFAVLKNNLGGGKVSGAGGGMDDLVPGSIEGKDEVRLADGEFVVPSDVVSGMGDGSTDQGVRKLHEMMARVRQDKTGRTAQPKPLNNRVMRA